MGRYWAILYALTIVSFSGLVTAQDEYQDYNYEDYYYYDDYNGTSAPLEVCSAPGVNHSICSLWYYGDSKL